MDPYRDNREAFRARAAELERLIADRREELAGLKFGRLLASLKWLIPAALLLVLSGWSLLQPGRLPSSLRSMEIWNARVVVSNHHGVARGTGCVVERDQPCKVVIVCGAFAYRGTGRCDHGDYRDDADTLTDGNPLCDIVGNHVTLREFFTKSDGSRHESWTIELERQ